MYIIYVNHDSVIKQICQLRDKAFLINETVEQKTSAPPPKKSWIRPSYGLVFRSVNDNIIALQIRLRKISMFALRYLRTWQHLE